jgi:hypothetical protein
MATEQERRDVEFKTFDGLTLRGWLYVGPKNGPAVIVNAAVIQTSTNTSHTLYPGKWFKLSLT